MTMMNRCYVPSALLACVVLLMIALLPTAPASALGVSDPGHGSNISAASQTRVAEYQKQYSEVASSTEFAEAKALYSELVRETASAPKSPGASTTLPVSSAYAHRACVTIYRWQIEALGWLLVAKGVVVGAIGGFVDATVIGIPVGAVLNAVGLVQGATGAFVIWWADTHFPVSRNICITW
jgi:hypothetical protein